MSESLLDAPAWRMREAILAREVSVAELVDATLTRIDERDASLHAFVHVAHDSAREAARAADAAVRTDADPGPLFGVPVSVKDVFHVAGMPTTAGLLLFGDVAREDSLHARRLRAGAIIVCKTNTPEFALFPRTINQLQEETVNPWDTMRSPGGSSGGAAASVAAGMTPLAQASDGEGSARIPAALCGVAGMPPTRGLVPHHGGVGGTLLFSSAGPTTADVRDMATMLQVLAGPFAGDPLASTAPAPDLLPGLDDGVSHIRMRWLASTGVAEPAERLTALVMTAASELGVDVEDAVTLPADRWQEPFYAMMGADRYAALGPDAYESISARARLTDYARCHLERGRSPEPITRARSSCALACRRKCARRLARPTCSCRPTTAIVAPRTDEPIVRPPLIGFTNFCNYADGAPPGVQRRAQRPLECRTDRRGRSPDVGRGHLR